MDTRVDLLQEKISDLHNTVGKLLVDIAVLQCRIAALEQRPTFVPVYPQCPNLPTPGSGVAPPPAWPWSPVFPPAWNPVYPNVPDVTCAQVPKPTST